MILVKYSQNKHRGTFINVWKKLKEKNEKWLQCLVWCKNELKLEFLFWLFVISNGQLKRLHTLIWILDLKFKPVIMVAILQLSSNIASNVTITLDKNCRMTILNDFLGLLFMILLLKIVQLDMKNRDTPQVSYTEEIQWKMKYNTNPSCLQSYIFQVA